MFKEIEDIVGDVFDFLCDGVLVFFDVLLMFFVFEFVGFGVEGQLAEGFSVFTYYLRETMAFL